MMKTTFVGMKKLAATLVIAAPTFSFAAGATTAASSTTPSDFAPIERMVILRVALMRDGNESAATLLNLAGADSRTIVQGLHEKTTNDVAVCQPTHVKDGSCPAQLNMQAESDKNIKLVATPRISPDGHILVDFDMQQTVSHALAGKTTAVRSDTFNFKTAMTLDPGVPVTVSAHEGWLMKVSGSVLNLKDPEPLVSAVE